jgi:hypothetical protein
MEDDFFSILQKSVKEISLSPVLLVAGLILGVLSLPGLVAYSQLGTTIQALASDYMLILLPLLIMPFITGGALGYALEVREKKSSSLNTFVESGKKHYMKLLMASIVAFLLYYFLIMAFLVVVLGFAMADPIIGVLLGIASGVLVFLILMAIEFYDIAIVADDVTVPQAFSNSINFARRNWLYAIVFFGIIVLAKFIVQMPLMFRMVGEFVTNPAYLNMTSLNATMNSTLTTPVTFGAPSLITVAILQAILQGFVLAFVTLYKTEFFMTVRSRKSIMDFDYEFAEDKKP